MSLWEKQSWERQTEGPWQETSPDQPLPLHSQGAIPSALLALSVWELAAPSNSDIDPQLLHHLVWFNENTPLPPGIQHMQGVDVWILNFVNKIFIISSTITKLTKTLCHKNLELYGICHSAPPVFHVKTSPSQNFWIYGTWQFKTKFSAYKTSQEVSGETTLN